ncbi:efflux RND transporter periplasmic adaptor subunit [Maribellus maritimus]|uniref:efflux RND transporter periplasmic adaptor subunit n=1 Tax=Maribellus maritimus TaxID=2870838 RepID=UPI001EEA94B2|nr:efflux RND transporter periplasmic adaptor subunit [Maribellus maritimus]MCG6189439.1 efflux RND transporter periplasmic adaptor subunit [Maribellus maritimus]
MKNKLLIAVVAAFYLAACSNQNSHSSDSEHNHEAEHVHTHEGEDEHEHHHHTEVHEEHAHNHETEAEHFHEESEHQGHNHEVPADREEAVNEVEHEHEELKSYITAYSDTYEVFAEADPFVAGEEADVLVHFTNLSDFSPLKSEKINMQMLVNGKTQNKTLDNPVKKGMYNFTIKPAASGKGQLIFAVENGSENEKIVADITVFKDDAEAHETIEATVPDKTNATVFTKSQSWKIDFATAYPKTEPFGQVIKTTAQVQSAPNDAQVLTAKTSGIVVFGNTSVLPGNKVSKGQNLFSISGNSFAENNSGVKFLEAKSNFEKTKLDYERIQGLAEDKIVTKARLLEAKNDFENAEAIYTNLSKNFSALGQTVKSPMKGFIQHLYVRNGEFVEAGQAIAIVSQNKNLMLYAEVQSKYAGDLVFLNSANISTANQQKMYSLEELNGQIVSWGKSANQSNYLIPVNIQIEDNGEFYPGNFVKIYLKTTSDQQALTIPSSSLLEEQGVYYAYVQLTPELFEKREIKTGTSDGLKTSVLAGLNPGERIVTKGAVVIKLSQASGALDPHAGHVH